ncbi:MAG: TetR/AcrR family transcriptional regulator [Chloroflexi bacterium]|nr:TetR/AcrR family transcriptional regulator [Chloroflexota bacterium]MCI0579384.1 TetR/AcrR family transcriptional regulator [Chloroflexota bacterium]MCI0643790.1 TetR/AcrR family transcriptional regulator [Chloroflexota bacterium]MCI0730022.1 TetR/AcrR family transcriptional regulator [Chloroflexota bacterium]
MTRQVKETDRRVIRTHTQLRQALYALILEKPYERISVQDILDRANIGRSTFYTHFLDKDDLLLSNVPENLVSFDADDGSLLPSLIPIFEHIRENYRLFRALMSSEGIGLVHKISEQKILQNWLSHMEGLRAKGVLITLPPVVAAHYLMGAFMALISWWLDEAMPYSPEEMDAMFRQLTLKGLVEMNG